MSGSLRSKLAVLILCLILATTGAAIFAMLNFGKGALLDEWEKAALANTRLPARSLVRPVSTRDASAMVRISSQASRKPDIKVVLTSGYPRTDDDGISLGTDELLRKPYSNVQLSACIRRVLDDGRAQ